MKYSEYRYIINRTNIESVNEVEKVESLFAIFENEYPAKKYGHNERTRLANWLASRPSCFNINYTSYSIIEIGKAWGYVTYKEDADSFVNNWFDFIAGKIIELRDKMAFIIND